MNQENAAKLARLAEALRAQNIDPDLVDPSLFSSPPDETPAQQTSQPPSSGPGVRFSAQAKSVPFSASSNDDFPPLSHSPKADKTKGAGSFPSGKPRHQSK